MFVSLHNSVPIKQQFLAEHRYLKYANYVFILIYSSLVLVVLLHYFLTDIVLRYRYKLSSSIIKFFKYIYFFNSKPPISKVRILLALFSPLQLTLNKYIPICLCPLHLYSFILSYKLRSRSQSTIYCIQVLLSTFSTRTF